ncbi:hypothetical protein [Arthrobacter nitrophenolicus]|uniref:Uncharacterized protein n=2 Tax=Arthrobacter nitrophenolicus TaxID=683150 RepID=A0ACC6THY1_9MICC|nr:hypothetical protein [Arthrobacter nitrophenolicus]ELT43547.1 hypothetical protein G205_17469 [Arthrobacter nitrophenolicus]
MSNGYNLADGTPRYGRRTGPGQNQQPTAVAPRVEEAAIGAAQLGLDTLAAAIDRRLSSSWADAQDPALMALRNENPEELAAARALVKLHLGSQREWRFKAQAIRDKRLAGMMARRKASGRALEVLALRLGLMAALFAPPAFVLATDQDNLLKLLVVGVICVVAALMGGHFLTVRARVPVMPVIRGPWLNELREDIINATLVAVLQNKGMHMDPETAAAGRRGWESIQAAEEATSRLYC